MSALSLQVSRIPITQERLRPVLVVVLLMLLSIPFAYCQNRLPECNETFVASEFSDDSIRVQTCLLNRYKFVYTQYPDEAGRYASSEQEVFILQSGKWIQTTNEAIFRPSAARLLRRINKEIHAQYSALSRQENAGFCFEGVELLSSYSFNDLTISFQGDEIWFSANWNDRKVCLAVGGAIVSIRRSKVRKFFKSNK